MLVKLGDEILNLEHATRIALDEERPDYSAPRVPVPGMPGMSTYPQFRAVCVTLQSVGESTWPVDSVEGLALRWWLTEATREQRVRAMEESRSMALDLVALYRRQPQL